ncbi:tRNA-dihydrouridine synthase [Reinekea blandensis]|uniref:tRNA-dihydrouridine(16) synthase n=1 Tax=Reinekea blandensis MED297 TaxID=314283 RepID=A4BCJ5_9GAMM|nr:tRNA-dihydrouridine synthase [Reinekea blandensis]EAR10261.1 NifR3/Smm1 family protein [Reinekea sp. MED297] [Reinekea blandensis MED297]
MSIYLAPMEGLADHYLRKLITQCGGYDLAVSEFVRVVDQLLPKRVFLEQVPELHQQGRTGAGTPVRVQLLGSHPQALAENALRAIELGSHGLDLNFGCPSKTVNASKGGAVLLTEPESIYAVVRSVRDALPGDQTLSAKMRLGFEDNSLMWECAHAIRDGGANEIIVHARTKQQGYTPPAYWHLPADFEARLGIPMIINGEIWTPADAGRAQHEANCSSIMLGRGAVRNPWLASEITGRHNQKSDWSQVHQLVVQFWQEVTQQMSPRYCAGRLKQWLNHLRLSFVEAERLFQRIRRLNTIDEINQVLPGFGDAN